MRPVPTPETGPPNPAPTEALGGESDFALIHIGTGARLLVKDGAVLGREGDVRRDFFEPLRKVSRRHAIVRRTGSGRWTIADMGSRNGTYVNGERLPVDVPKPLQAGDIVKLADQSFVVSLARDGDSAS
ncbi:MAG: FHA domain-containing protein [Firmicutes bacterium]|nr:FHA domain-containing protein [Bacillota bacterium]